MVLVNIYASRLSGYKSSWDYFNKTIKLSVSTEYVIVILRVKLAFYNVLKKD